MNKLIITRENRNIVIEELEKLFNTIKQDINTLIENNEELELKVGPKRLTGPDLEPEGFEVSIYAFGDVLFKIIKNQEIDKF